MNKIKTVRVKIIHVSFIIIISYLILGLITTCSTYNDDIQADENVTKKSTNGATDKSK